MKRFFGLAALALVVCGAQQAEAVNCNAQYNRCIIALEFDNTSTKTCADRAASSSCTTVCGSYGCRYYYNADCVQNYGYAPPGIVGSWKCSSFRGMEGEQQVESSEVADTFTTCGSSGEFCGWRAQINRSGNGSPNASRAKLHSCAVDGYLDESDYGTSNSVCQGYASDTNVNGYCDSSVWSSLCTSAAF